MIIGIGCDVVEHSLTDRLNWHTKKSAQKRVFSDKELSICKRNNAIKFLSGRYAAKEAILKSLGIGMIDGIKLSDIEILQSELGAPIITLKGTVKKISDNLGISVWHVSISHTKTSSTAFVLAHS